MIIWFLRLFSRFRQLEAIEHDETELRNLRRQVDVLQNENTRLQDRMDAVIEDRSRMWDMLGRATKSMETSYQALANIQWQRTNGTIPYPDAPHLKPKPAEEEQPASFGRQTRATTSEMINRRTREYLTTLSEQVSSSKS